MQIPLNDTGFAPQSGNTPAGQNSGGIVTTGLNSGSPYTVPLYATFRGTGKFFDIESLVVPYCVLATNASTAATATSATINLSLTDGIGGSPLWVFSDTIPLYPDSAATTVAIGAGLAQDNFNNPIRVAPTNTLGFILTAILNAPATSSVTLAIMATLKVGAGTVVASPGRLTYSIPSPA